MEETEDEELLSGEEAYNYYKSLKNNSVKSSIYKKVSQRISIFSYRYIIES